MKLGLILALAATLVSLKGAAYAASAPDVDWPSYNNDLQGQRYSKLAQITVANAKSLHQICALKLAESGPYQGTPLVVQGTIFTTTAHDTYAVDAQTCAVKWRSHYTAVGVEPFPLNRGVALADGKIIRGEPDGHLVALDATDGTKLWDVAPASGKRGEFLSSAPIVWHDRVLIGTAGSDWGVKGRMMAFDADTGKKLWTFTTIASGSDPNAKSWQSAQSTATGGGGMWTSYALDPKTGEVFIPVANPAPDFASAYRPGSNLYTDSIVVLDAQTGKLKWYYQAIKHDVNDYDIAAPPVLYTVNGNQMVGFAGKDGRVYGLNRASHALAYRVVEARTVNQGIPTTTKGIHVCPIDLGGAEWNGPAFDAGNHRLITPMNDWCGTIVLGSTRYVTGQFFFGGTVTRDPYPQARGALMSLDAATGAVAWKYVSTSPMLAGVTPTAGGVTFTGDMAGNLLVFNSATGSVLGKHLTPGSIAGGVVTYSDGGKQYVAATSGNISRLTWGLGGHPTLVVFGL